MKYNHPIDFEVVKTEGIRVGYWCEVCEKAFPVDTRELGERGIQFLDLYCKKCNSSVTGIYPTKQPE